MKDKFSVNEKRIVITGGAGVLGASIAEALATAGAHVAILDIDENRIIEVTRKIQKINPNVVGLKADVLNRESLQKACDLVLNKFGSVDILINGAGGNHPKATTSDELSFFDLPADSMQFVNDLNLMGTIIPSQIFGKYFADKKVGVILNVSSMNAFRPLTRIPSYSAAKAAVSNFTQWLAVHMAQNYSPKIRVNAIAPGFFLTKQNEFLLKDEKTGGLTARGQQIIDHTPMGHFGDPEDLTGTIIWLLSNASSFVTGIVVPVDGGFSAYSGV
jgi:NAD(P)-dependent dehydrogenase (short-subunit alcohol dehydrogenase family)